ncbi:MAG TPA: hypothetical protein VFE45_00495, partial [Coriobacteriia bacterium]|nr:hypothetical protein [Coriobacteriia bacterium]
MSGTGRCPAASLRRSSSFSESAPMLWLLDRLSDAAGQRPVPDNDGYLTGYPLPNGTYALARTWYAHDAPRPNSVWTHTLLLPHGALDGTDVSRLVSALHAPGSANDLESYAQPFDVTELLHGHPEPLTDVALVADAVTSLYFVGETPAWVELPDVRRRNTLALALWSQQWPRLRRRFTFCTGAIELRRLDQRPVDLLLRPPGYTGIVHASAGGSASYGIDAWRVLVDDLGHPGLLREFLRRCGSDTSRLESAALFAGVWASAVRTDEPLRVTFDRVVAAAPLPTQLRRLKRSLLRGKQAILLCRDAFEVVEGLTQPRIGQALYAEDVGLEDWLGRLWDDDPRALGTALRQATAAETDGRESPATVTESMVRFARSIVLRRARPADLPWVAVDAPNVAADLLSTHA